eukprot:CAMPEP_0198123086 /NCGR_PEP_ID=MMETSP1442-20131203/36629_1 /TAXON_ID= /ORGANISM="Craspedostauros australis, Strain CCMP3328" /LENGTH=174 /DNA_ID=CAMNT_0043782239 /DNA_START=163 /DNA_END=687 /DNA_ORIENTATION=+
MPTTTIGRRISTTHLSATSEQDVWKAVERAESLWEEALEARKNANAMSDRAEEEAEAAASQSTEVNEMLSNMKSISLEKIAQADTVAAASLDAGSILRKALDAKEEADRLEALAEEALEESEVVLDQHLQDFPDSPLADLDVEGDDVNDDGDDVGDDVGGKDESAADTGDKSKQ